MNLSTGFADQVVMLVGCEIKMFGTLTGGEFDDLTELYQEIQISVYCAKADIRELLSDGEIESISSRVIRTVHQIGLNGLSLATVL